jgi:hypothetical protein
MNLLTMMTLAVLVPGTGADTENTDVWVLVTSKHVATVAAEDAESLKKGGQGILVKCKSLKINFTAEGKVTECENCVLYHTTTGMSGTAHSAVFDQVGGILTLTGDETTPVEWTIEKNEDGEQKIFSQSMQITIPTAKRRPRRDDTRMFDEPIPDPFARRQATPQKPPVEDRPRTIPDPLFEDGGRQQLNPVKPPVDPNRTRRFDQQPLTPVEPPVDPVRTEPQLN